MECAAGNAKKRIGVGVRVGRWDKEEQEEEEEAEEEECGPACPQLIALGRISC